MVFKEKTMKQLVKFHYVYQSKESREVEWKKRISTVRGGFRVLVVEREAKS